MKQELVKIYGNVHPAGPELFGAVRAVLEAWHLGDCVELDGDLLRLAHEGVFFPTEDVLETLGPFLSCSSSGRLDVLDLEAWTLTRYRFEGRRTLPSIRSLNDILAYSGM